MGVLRRVRENVVKSGHVVGLGSSLVLNPSRESKPIGYVDNSGRLQSEARRCTHGAGWKRFLRLQCTSLLTRAEKVDLPVELPAWTDVHEYVRANFGPGSERHTEKTASLSLDFREKDGPRPILQVGSNHVPFNNRVVTHAQGYRRLAPWGARSSSFPVLLGISGSAPRAVSFLHILFTSVTPQAIMRHQPARVRVQRAAAQHAPTSDGYIPFARVRVRRDRSAQTAPAAPPAAPGWPPRGLDRPRPRLWQRPASPPPP